eukprot:UN05389
MEPTYKPKSLSMIVSRAPAVKPAHMGQSINPKQEHYESLVSEAAAIELRKEEQLDHQMRATRAMTAELIDKYGKEKVKEMSDAEKIKLFIGEKPEDKPVEVAVKKPTERKTTTQRNKENRIKAREEALEAQRKEKKFQKSIGTIGTVKKEMKKDDETKKQQEAYKLAKKQYKDEMESKGVIVGKTKVGKHRFSEPAIEAQMPRNDVEGVQTSVRRANAIMGSAIR